MLHYITLGHLDSEAIGRGVVVTTMPLDLAIVEDLLLRHGERHESGQYLLGGHVVEVDQGFVRCPWLMPERVAETEKFASDLVERTGCLIAEVQGRRMLGRDQLKQYPSPETIQDWESAVESTLAQTRLGRERFAQ